MYYQGKKKLQAVTQNNYFFVVPYLGLLTEPDVCEGILPLGQPEVHDHEAVVRREGVGDVVPAQGPVQEPHLHMWVRSPYNTQGGHRCMAGGFTAGEIQVRLN